MFRGAYFKLAIKPFDVAGNLHQFLRLRAGVADLEHAPLLVIVDETGKLPGVDIAKRLALIDQRLDMSRLDGIPEIGSENPSSLIHIFSPPGLEEDVGRHLGINTRAALEGSHGGLDHLVVKIGNRVLVEGIGLVQNIRLWKSLDDSVHLAFEVLQGTVSHARRQIVVVDPIAHP